MIYLDTSALLTLVFVEPESADLRQWLDVRAVLRPVSSELARVELTRAVRRIDARGLPAARGLLAGIDLVPLTGAVVDESAEVEGPLLRSLDALHLASALSLRPHLTAFVAYDRGLLAAASAVGLHTESPGA